MLITLSAFKRSPQEKNTKTVMSERAISNPENQERNPQQANLLLLRFAERLALILFYVIKFLGIGLQAIGQLQDILTRPKATEVKLLTIEFIRYAKRA